MPNTRRRLIGRVVSKVPAAEVHRGRAAVVEFNPIGIVTIFVDQSAGIVGEKFGNDH